MKENNKITLTDDELEQFSDVRDQMVNDIKSELASMGYEPIPQHYQGQDDLVKIVDKAHQLRMQYQEAVDVIKDTYSEKVAAERLKVLEVDHKLDMQSLVDDIDDIVAKDHQYREMALKELVSDPNYKATKMEVLNIMSILQNIDANYEIVADIIEPIVAAKDTKSLQIVKLLTKDAASKYMIDKAIDNINNYKANVELSNFVDAAKKFITKGDAELTLMHYMKLYGGDQ